MTSDMGVHIWYAAGRQVARSFFHWISRLFTDAFNEVDWPQVHWMLKEEVPRLFQVWACKQVMNIAATNKNLRQRQCDGRSNKCPCCTIHVETTEHILLCPKEGQIEAFRLATTALERWLNEADTDPDLADYILEYGGGSPRSSAQVSDDGTFSGQDWVETVTQGDDIKRNYCRTETM